MTRKKMTDKKGELTSTEADFLKGKADGVHSDSPTQQPEQKAVATNDSKSPTDIMSQILAPPATKEATTRFTADLPDSLHKRLTMAAAMSGKKKVDIVRELLDASLPQVPK